MMNILLLGEWSGFYTNLKRGLLELGHNCVLASAGDGWKKIEGSDINLFEGRRNSFISRLFTCNIKPFLSRRQFYGYDIVMFVCPEVFPTLINRIMFNSILKHNKKVFVSVAGGCFSLYNSYEQGKLGYYTFDNNPKTSLMYSRNDIKTRIRRSNEGYIYKHADGIIPIMYEYAVGVRGLVNTRETIPLPFDATQLEYCPNIVHDKIRIMHGVIREKSKGTDYIVKALKIIEERHPDEVEVIIDGKMPLKDYLEKLKTINVLVDQCKEHCYGLNALYAMAEGRIVLGGATELSLKELGVDYCPVVHISPDVDTIVDQLEYVIKNKNSFEEWGRKSREYVESVHDYRLIAQRYVDTWNEEQ